MVFHLECRYWVNKQREFGYALKDYPKEEQGSSHDIGVLNSTYCRFVQVDPNIYIRRLLECGNSRALAEGKTIHGHMVKTDFEPSIYLWNCMIDMYVKCGRIKDACQAFDTIPKRDACSWTTVLTGYAKCGYVENAQSLFEKMHERSIVSWNAMIVAYARCGDQVEAMDLYGQMQWMAMKPNEFTLASVVSACMVDLGYGRKIHGPVVKLGFESNVFVGIALVDMYVKCGRVAGARQMFYLMPVRNIVSWTAMVAGYAQNGQVDEATRFFNQIHQTDMKPNELTFVSVVNACVIHIDL